MFGYMNVLLVEVGVFYDLIVDMDDINFEFVNIDVVLVIGVNDVVNLVVCIDLVSLIYGMLVLDVVNVCNVVVIKCGKGIGFVGIENVLFYVDNICMFYGDGVEVVVLLVSELKVFDGGY